MHQSTTPTLDVTCPATGETEKSTPVTPIEDLPEILERARQTQRYWQSASFAERKEVLMRMVDVVRDSCQEIAEKICRYNGKLVDEALIAEIFPALSSFQFFASKSEKFLKRERVVPGALPVADCWIDYDPVGVVGIISPWNYPFMLALSDLPAALMAGNSVILKPSEFSAGIGLLLEDLFKRAKFPENLVQVIYGRGDLGESLIGSGINMISFTGSTATGKKVYQSAARAMIPCVLELGGKDAAIVLEDAEFYTAVPGIVWAGFVNCGQTCASVETVYVPRRREKEFLAELKNYFERIPNSNFGVMNTLLQKDIVANQFQEAVSRGAHVLASKKLSGDGNKFRQDAHILTNVPKDTALFQQETFGPLIHVIAYDSLEDVLKDLNTAPMALTTSVWTADAEVGKQLAQRIDAGSVTINDHMVTAGMPEAPWGGHRQSGLGFSMSHLALKKFSKVKFVFHDRGLVKFKFWQYPYYPAKRRFIGRLIRANFSRSFLTRWLLKLIVFPKVLFGREKF